ncbi:MAG: hypothetical protein ACNA8R_08060 [Nitriliruptoraceae bacterium]
MGARRWLVLGLVLGLLAGCAAPADDIPDDPDDGGAEPVPAPDPDDEVDPEPAPGPDTVQVWIHLTNDRFGDPCTDVYPVPRQVPADDPLTGALEALLAGPTDDELSQGYWSWFSDETAGMLRSVDVVSGTVIVRFGDLREIIPNASTSCGSSALLAQLDRTVLGVAEGVAPPVRYAIEGDQDAFYEWLQLGPPGGVPERSSDADEPGEPDAARPTDLADGRHAVLLHAADLPGRSLTVDVIQFLTGEEARIAYAEDHPDDPDGPPNDFYIRNVNPRLRTLLAAADVEVTLIHLDADPAAVVSSWETLLDDLTSEPSDHDLVSYNPFWLTVEGGVVTRIEEQYVP